MAEAREFFRALDLGPGRTYDLQFHTFPAPDRATPLVRFVAMGDYGVGIKSDSESSRRQRRVAAVLDRLVRHHDVRFVLSLGDNIYHGHDLEDRLAEARIDHGASVFAYRVADPERYGVVEFDSEFRALSLEEKPVAP